MADTSNFALRMPPAYKAAAQALTKTYFHEPSEKGEGYINSIALFSINEALLYLIGTGLKVAGQHLDAYALEETKACEAWRELITFFMASNRAVALPSDLDSYPAAQALVRDIMYPDGATLDEDWESGVDQRTALDELSWRQDALTRVAAAKLAINTASSASRDVEPRKAKTPLMRDEPAPRRQPALKLVATREEGEP